MSNPNLLIFHQGALGDLVTLFPLLTRLRGRYPVIEIICKNQIGRLARHLQLVDAAYPAESAVFSALFREGPIPEPLNRLSRYSMILLFSFSTDLYQRVRALTQASVHLIPPRPAPDQLIHISDHYATCLEPLSVWSRRPPERQISRPLYRERRMPGFNPKRVIVHPGSGSQRKNWALDNFLSLGLLLSIQGLEITFLAGPAEGHLALNAIHPIVKPPDLVALTELLENAGAFIGNDSGVSHLASFLGLPTVAIFGPSDPRRWAPRGPATAIVSCAKDCTACFETMAAPPCESMHCLKDITPATVMTSFLEIYSI